MLQPNQKSCGGCSQTFHFQVVHIKESAKFSECSKSYRITEW